jgi:ABC-type multidrug transport system ATPase subunit
MLDEQSGGRLTGISKRFARRGPWILKEIDLDLPAASRTVIIGDNGSGKSTLLRVAAGLTNPTSGSVVRPADVSFVPERLAGRSMFTAWEYICHMGRIRGLSPVTMETRGHELLDSLGLQPSPYVSVDSLSKGNKQKLVIAQAFLAPVSLMVLDEPHGGLDTPARRTLDRLIEGSRASGAAILITSHSVPTASKDDRVYRISDGLLYRMTPVARESVDEAYELREIDLAATESACAPDRLWVLPGVRNADYDQPRRVLSLLVESSDADAFLYEAIAGGWSVTRVNPGQSEGVPS